MFSGWFEWISSFYFASFLLFLIFFFISLYTLSLSKLVVFWPHSILFDNYLRIVVRIFITLFMEVSQENICLWLSQNIYIKL